jgi:hypothetical protein
MRTTLLPWSTVCSLTFLKISRAFIIPDDYNWFKNILTNVFFINKNQFVTLFTIHELCAQADLQKSYLYHLLPWDHLISSVWRDTGIFPSHIYNPTVYIYIYIVQQAMAEYVSDAPLFISGKWKTTEIWRYRFHTEIWRYRLPYQYHQK